jgi:gamma-glutamylcyclotransferase (GGCT)/AIG2-like uncharacterized protein YtfP
MNANEGPPLYFAYGSNLNPRQMGERCPGHRVVGRASLADYALRFRGYGRDWAGAVGTVEPEPGSTVWGAVFEVTPAHYATLDEYEGYDGPGEASNLYERVPVTVDLEGAGATSCLTYVIRPDAEGLPSRAYLDAILAGLRHHALPAEYVEELARHAVAPAVVGEEWP